MEEWLKTKEAAKYLQVHPKTLYRYVKAGMLRQYQTGGVGRPRFKREELDALLQGEGESVNAGASTVEAQQAQQLLTAANPGVGPTPMRPAVLGAPLRRTRTTKATLRELKIVLLQAVELISELEDIVDEEE
jgi:excisionase family DNA binding protein